jgi:hypothetical protein
MLFNKTAKEEATMQRIQRGFLRDGEAAFFESDKAVREAFPEITKKMTSGEIEILLEKIRKIING